MHTYNVGHTQWCISVNGAKNVHTQIHTYILGPRGSLTLAEGSRTNICFYCQVCTTWRRNTLHLIICTHIIIFPLNHEWTSKTPLKTYNKVYVCTPLKTSYSPTKLEDKEEQKQRNDICNIDKIHFFNSVIL